MEPPDLEVIAAEDDQPGPPKTRPSPRRWPWLAVLGVVVIGGCIYSLAARSAVRALEQHWLAACDAATRAQSGVPHTYNPGSPPLLPEERQALERRARDVEAEALAGIRNRVRRVRTIDPGVQRLRDAVYDAVQPLNVNSCAPPRSDPPRRIDAILRAQLKRWRLSPVTEVAKPVPLPPVTITTLPIATETTGSTLLLGTGSSVFVVDIDAGTTREIRDVPPGFVSGRGWLVRRSGTDAFLERLGEPPLPLGTTSYLAPAANDDSVWLVTTTGELAEARKVDTRRGTTRGPAVTLPQFATLFGEVSNGLVVLNEASATVAVWDPIAARTLLEVGSTDSVPVARGELIARSTCGLHTCDLHLTNASTGRQRTVPLDGWINSFAISPDGRTVAAAVQSEYRNVGDVNLVDVATGHMRRLLTSWTGQTAIVWGPAGDRVFLVSGLGREVWMYAAVDRGSSEQLRVRIRSASPFEAIAVL